MSLSYYLQRFHPEFPSTSPYVTSVGATDFKTYDIGDEVAWSLTGGGFSDVFPQPSYQAPAVAKYKSTATLPDASYFNATGRGYPDVSALGGEKTPYCVAYYFNVDWGAGTSVSTPVVAGMVAMLNGKRLDAGKSPLGFLNPLLYAHPEAFFDVLDGNNGFPTAPLWDPVSGMGTINYQKLEQIVMDLP